MFDSTVIRTRSAAAARPWGVLTISIVVHTLVVLGALALSLAGTSLPRYAPDQIEAFRPITVPLVQPPVGRPDAPRTAVSKPAAGAPLPVARIPQVTAPALVPEHAAPVDSGAAAGPEGLPGATGTAADVPWGSPDGVPGGTGTEATSATIAPDAPQWPGGEVQAARVMSRVDPRYPAMLAGARLRSVTVVVRCIVDRQGRPRDIEIVRSSFAPFNEAVVEALSQWKFAPGSFRGTAVDTWFELTVTFEVK